MKLWVWLVLYVPQTINATMADKDTKIVRKKAGKIKPMKIAALVVSAIQDLRETKGSTPKKIAGYISYASSLSEENVKRRVSANCEIFTIPPKII